ncbi:LacI family DNA-binding transcriptional regulator [Gryllotalpicola protaetiae]|uniref:LacI family transcriptional regulator n=1 Tax=Gryllotalpicola protaetiae TaxID=2419771 RepID=A0A387BRF2_9MICO|nr:LacI family DNA-binding transcriptional regulator [Gryllotalpicola protaetiae]AYG03639.1 LacI family transcriptional regulator [Gryllotalpicola protaetiae]
MPDASAPRQVTVADIAEEAGVSIATVSKVLNDRVDVSPVTRERVKALIIERGYVKNVRSHPHKNTREEHVGLIDIVFNDAASPWAAEVIRGVEATARAGQASAVISVDDGGPSAPGARWVDAIAARGSIGAIVGAPLSEADQQRLTRLGVPAIMVDPMGDFNSAVPSFGPDNWSGGLSATNHLIELGHRRIATITGPMRFLCSQARLAGYGAALERAGLASDPALVEQGDFHRQTAVEAAMKLLQLDDRPTAIFAANDEQALGVYEAAQRLGLSVPGDVSVVGFDDVPMSQWALPGLTTVRAPIQSLAELATTAILNAHSGTAPLPVGRMELPTTLVVRGSTAAPAA